MGFVAVVAIATLVTYWLSYNELDPINRVELFVIGLGYTIPTVFRRVWPNASAGIIVTMAIFRYLSFPNTIAMLDIALLFSLYAVIVHGRRAVAVITSITAILSVALYWLPSLSDFNREYLLSFLFAESMIFAVISTAQARHSQLLQSHRFALAEKERQIQRERDEQIAVVRERTSIARDMHDVVAHTLAVVVSQADGGRYAGRKDPEKALLALDTIAELSRAALGDIRSILSVLREPRDPNAPLTPQPVAQDISKLIDTLQEAGHTVSFSEINEPYPLPAGLGAAIYRITQEALTNSIKHGGPGMDMTVQLDWRPNAITASILDNGRGASVSSDGKGNGLIGMAERAAQFGGTLEAGPRPGGGFQVIARIPVKRSERTSS